MKLTGTFLLAAASLISFPIYGESTGDSSSDNRPLFGLKAMFDVNLPGKWHYESGSVKMYKAGLGFSLGGVYNLGLGSGFYLEPGISVFYDTHSYDLVVADGPDGRLETDPSEYKIGLRIPVVVGYDINLGNDKYMSVFTGPELNYAFAGDVRYDKSEISEEIFSGPFEFQRRVDCAWRVGVGFPTGNWQISLEASIGMTDLLKSKGMSYRENRLNLGVTRYF